MIAGVDPIRVLRKVPGRTPRKPNDRIVTFADDDDVRAGRHLRGDERAHPFDEPGVLIARAGSAGRPTEIGNRPRWPGKYPLDGPGELVGRVRAAVRREDVLAASP